MKELRVMRSVIRKMINVFVEGIFIKWMSNSAVKCVLILVKMCRLTGVRFWVGKGRILSELVLSLPSNSPQPPLKHPSKVRAKNAPRQKIFTLVKLFMSYCEVFFWNMRTKLLSCNTISYITSPRNMHNELWML